MRSEAAGFPGLRSPALTVEPDAVRVTAPAGWGDRAALGALRPSLSRALSPPLPPREQWPEHWHDAVAERIVPARDGRAARVRRGNGCTLAARALRAVIALHEAAAVKERHAAFYLRQAFVCAVDATRRADALALREALPDVWERLRSAPEPEYPRRRWRAARPAARRRAGGVGQPRGGEAGGGARRRDVVRGGGGDGGGGRARRPRAATGRGLAGARRGRGRRG